jgi:GAF domain-containing protein
MVDAGALVKELQKMRDDGHLSDALLRYAVRGIEPSDDRYSWVGVYRMDEGGDDVWLHNYLGAGTDHARIPLGTGVCGKAAADKANFMVGDVSKEAEEHVLVSDDDIQSEMAVLIRAGDDVFGVIKIESEEANAFTEEDETGVQLVAEKLAEQMMAERRQ